MIKTFAVVVLAATQAPSADAPANKKTDEWCGGDPACVFEGALR